MKDQSNYLKAAGLGAIVVLYIHATGVLAMATIGKDININHHRNNSPYTCTLLFLNHL